MLIHLTMLLAVFSGFNGLFSALISLKSKRKAKDFFLGLALASNKAFFFYLNLTIALQSAMLWFHLSQ
jgi:hypothetical protein